MKSAGRTEVDRGERSGQRVPQPVSDRLSIGGETPTSFCVSELLPQPGHTLVESEHNPIKRRGVDIHHIDALLGVVGLVPIENANPRGEGCNALTAAAFDLQTGRKQRNKAITRLCEQTMAHAVNGAP
jgi:hypothetical protein